MEATEQFRAQRLEEPLELYSEKFEHYRLPVKTIIAALPRLSQGKVDLALIEQILGDPDLLVVFRYLAAPRISEDDLKTVAGTRLTATAIKADGQAASRIRDTILKTIDPYRFPWLSEGRSPTSEEMKAAILATTALIAAQRVETHRRGDAKSRQEKSVYAVLADMGFKQVGARTIKHLADAPRAGEFCGESMLGGKRADIVVGLYDQRVLALECKVSNSQVNSFKRINHEALGKAQAWLGAFGRASLVPGAVIAGVFSPANLEAAQRSGLFLFWSHRLHDLKPLLEAAKPPNGKKSAKNRKN